MNVSLVWQRMLSILGDINKIESPDNHALAMKCVSEIWMLLQEVIIIVLNSALMYYINRLSVT